MSETGIPREFVILDFETSGLSPVRGADVVEVGAVRLVDRAVVATFEELARPTLPIPKWATAVHTITDELVAGSPHFLTILPDLLEFLGGAPMVAHNAGFDRAFLDRSLRHQGRPALASVVLDSLALSRRLFPEVPRHDLATLCHWHGIRRVRVHRALDDALATAALFARILERAEEQGVADFETLCELGERTERTPGPHAGPIRLDLAEQELLEDSLVTGECVRIRYFSRRGTEMERSIVPYRVDEVRGVPRLIAYDVRRGATQSFRLDRVAGVVRVGDDA